MITNYTIWWKYNCELGLNWEVVENVITSSACKIRVKCIILARNELNSMIECSMLCGIFQLWQGWSGWQHSVNMLDMSLKLMTTYFSTSSLYLDIWWKEKKLWKTITDFSCACYGHKEWWVYFDCLWCCLIIKMVK